MYTTTNNNQSTRAEEVMAIKIESIVSDWIPLLVAMLLSPPVEEDRMRSEYRGSQKMEHFLNVVNHLRRDTIQLLTFIEVGHFAKSVEYLLSVAKTSLDVGARLMRILCTALAYADTLKISDDLKEKILHQIQWHCEHDSFVIDSWPVTG